MGAGRQIFRALFFLLILLAGLSGLALAQDVSGQANRLADSLRADLQRLQTELQLPTLSDDQLANDRRALDDISAKALAQAGAMVSPISDLQQQIDKLTPPAKDQTEPEAITAQRSALQASVDKLQAAKAQLEVISVEANQLSGRASSIQRDQFFARVFERSKSIANPSLWYDTWVGLGLLTQRLINLFVNWWGETRQGMNYAGLLIAPLAIAILGGAYVFLRRRFSRWFDVGVLASRSPDEIDRLWRVCRAVIGAIALVLGIELAMALALQVSNLSTPRIDVVFEAVAVVVLQTAVYFVLGSRLAAPGLPAWRLLSLDDATASRFTVLFTLAAFVSALTNQLQTLTDKLFLPVSNTIGQSAISAAIMLVLIALIMLIFSQHHQEEKAVSQHKTYFGWVRPFTPILWALLLLATLALLFGYISLSSFISQQIFETATLVVILFLIHHLTDAAVAASIDPSTAFGRFLRRIGGLSDAGISRLGLFFRTVVDILLVVIGLPLLFVQWTLTWVDFPSLVNTAVFGFRLGDVIVSPGSVLLLILIAVSGVVLTNLIVKWLDVRILSDTHFSKGVQDSVTKAASYTGYLVAALFAFTAAGVDFSNLAFIFGALGVGIGLGLQSIVNNFVSGLILLAERPIRQGDWITISSGEGIVKRIDVRSTQIESFDRSTLIVPNSMLITEPVRNWTLGDASGRFVIAITVEHGNDPEAICKMLKDIADANRAVMSDPPSAAILSSFGDTGLKFELKGYVADVFEANLVASDVRIAIYKALRDAEIHMVVVPPRWTP